MSILDSIKKNTLYLKLRYLYKSGESNLLLKQRVALYKNFCKENDLVFDVGANIGNRVEAFLALRNKVVAVEPQSFCRKVLRARFGKAISIVGKGLGEKAEVKTMYIATNATQISSFSKDWIDSMKKDRFINEQWDAEEKIELTTLEDLIVQFGIPAFVKIDVEGFEVNVLKGLKTAVPSLSFEYAVPEEIARVQACLELIHQLSPGYKYNYSIGESMVMALAEYCDYNQFKIIISSETFLRSSFGDVYVKKFG
jgi:FkbM family methyltransferase